MQPVAEGKNQPAIMTSLRTADVRGTVAPRNQNNEDTMKVKSRTAAWSAAIALALFSAQVFAVVEVGGIRVDDDVTVANQKLVLNGAGIRTRAFFKVYVAALYLPAKRNDPKEVLALQGAKRVAVTMLREVSSDELGEALVTGIRKNSSPDEIRRFGSQLIAMGNIFGQIPKLKKGESFNVDWVPGKGTIVSVDGKPVADPIPEEAFYNAILRIWLGDEPADSSLKPAMLGTK